MLLVFVLAIALAPAVLLMPHVLWVRALRRDAAVPRLVIWTISAVLLLGASTSLVGAVVAGRATTNAPPAAAGAVSQRARLLGLGISEALNSGALVVLVAVVSALALLFCTWWWRWRPRRRA